MNLSRWNLTDSEISLLSKGLNFIRISNSIDKANLKTKLESLVRIFQLKWHFRNEDNEFDLEQFNPNSTFPDKKKKSTFNLRNKDAATEIYMSSLEETLMKIEIPTHECDNITRKERKALQDLENDKNIVIKGADRGL